MKLKFLVASLGTLPQTRRPNIKLLLLPASAVNFLYHQISSFVDLSPKIYLFYPPCTPYSASLWDIALPSSTYPFQPQPAVMEGKLTFVLLPTLLTSGILGP